MSVKQMGHVWDLDLPPLRKLVLVALADHADHDGEKVYPSVGRIAHKTGLSHRQVQYEMKALRDEDKVISLVRKGGGRSNPSEYKLTLENGALLPPFQPTNNSAQHAPIDLERVQDTSERVHTTSLKGAQHAPEPSLTIREPSSPIGDKQSSKPVAVENRTQSQTLADDFYRRLQDRHKVRLEKEQYGFHLGSFKNMLEKDEPTEEEIDRVLAHMVEVFPTAPKIRATKALQDVRLGRDTGEAWSGPAPWEGRNEPLNPASDEAFAKRDKPNAPTWYATFYPVSISGAETMLREHDTHSAMLDALERRASA